MARSARSLSVEAREALFRGDMAKVAVARDWELLREIARLAQEDAPLELAATDPAQFQTWRKAVTLYHLKGWGAMTPERVDRVAAKDAAVAAARARGENPREILRAPPPDLPAP